MATKKASTPTQKKTTTNTKRAKAHGSSTKKNKLGVKNSLVKNINARREKGITRTKKRSTVSKKAYGKMEENWSSDD